MSKSANRWSTLRAVSPPSRHPYLDTAGPIGFAHRGGAEEAPENTLPAFLAAASLGYRYQETDVHLSRDGVLMAFHDASLDRVTDAVGRISDLTAAQIEAADAAHGYSPDGGVSHPLRGRGITVPRLETLLEALPRARFNIDPKTDSTVEPLMALLRRFDAFDRVCVGSFSDRRISRLRRLGGERLCTSMGPRAVTVARLSSLSGRMPALGARCVQIPMGHAGVRLVDRALVAATHRAGLALHIWTINNVNTMNRLLDLGVDGIMTDQPTTLRDVMARHGWAVDGSGRLVG